MPFTFLPRDRRFWLLHIGASGCAVMAALASALLWGPISSRQLAGIVVWIVPYTVIVLGFRWLYRGRHRGALNMGRAIPLVIGYGTLGGVVLVLADSALLLPFFRDEIGIGWSHVYRELQAGALQAQLFICTWCFIYISVSGQRDAQDAELRNLTLQDSLRAAQLGDLSDRLNPQMLFRSLDAIRQTARVDADRADSMLVGLAEILRYSLESSRRAKVRLDEDLDNLRRFGALAGSTADAAWVLLPRVPAACHRLLVPPMAIQTLVEDLVGAGARGSLTLDVREAAQGLVIELGADCCGAVDVTALAKRLDMLYGAGATLAQGFHKITLTLPRESAAAYPSPPDNRRFSANNLA